MGDSQGVGSCILPLEGLRVLELGRVLAGPFASLLLEDLGAEIVKVENTTDGDSTRATAPFVNGLSHYFLCVNRGKRGVSIDARAPEGASLIRDLVKKSDVVIHNFRPDLARRAGADFPTLSAIRPGIVSCAITGFGSTSSKGEDPAYDLVLEAITGMLEVTGRFGEDPVKAGVPVADLFTGLYATVGILAGLLQRREHGGVELDLSLFDVTLSLLGSLAEFYLMTGTNTAAQGGRSHSIAPHEVYRTTDGLIAVVCPSEAQWLDLCDALGSGDLAADPRFASNHERVVHFEALDHVLGECFARRPTAEWMALLSRAAVPSAPVLDVGQVLSWQELRAKGMVCSVDYVNGSSVEMVATPFVFRGPDGVDHRNLPRTAPALGGDTESVLRELLALSSEEIDDLAGRGIVSTPNSRSKAAAR